MRKRIKVSTQRAEILEALQGGLPLPAGVARKPLRTQPDSSFQELTKLDQQATKARHKIRKPVEPISESVLNELRGVTDKVAKRKPFLPVLPIDIAGSVWGSYTVIATPPYFRAQAVTGDLVGNPDATSNANGETGELSCRVVTSMSGKSSGNVAAYLAVYFRPIFSQANVRIHANMDIDFAWWVNSIGPAASSRAQGLMRVYIDDSFQVASRGAFLGWSIQKEQEVAFNFGTYPSPSWSLNLPVSHKHYYLVVFSLECSASGAGWPGSIAGTQVNIRIPSVRFDVEALPILAQ